MNYYNEFDPKAAQWLRNLIAAGLIPAGDVDERSITEVVPDDIRRYTQCHFFAGIGGWSYALQLAGWPTDRNVWTGSCPCQPFSSAGAQRGTTDERHLWPIWFDLIRACRPDVVMGEQVAAAIGHGWFDGVCSDLEDEGYTWGAAIIPACAVNAPHRRDRLWFVADAANEGSFSGSQFGIHSGEKSAGAWHEHVERRGLRFVANPSGGRCAESGEGQDEQQRGTQIVRPGDGSLANTNENGCAASSVGEFHNEEHNIESRRTVGNAHSAGSQRHGGLVPEHDSQGWEESSGLCAEAGFWSDCEWITGADGKARRVEPSIPLLAHGVPARVAKLRAIGNAIVPQVAAEVIGAYMEVRGL